MHCEIVGVTPATFKNGGTRFSLSLLSNSSSTYGRKASIVDLYDNTPAFQQQLLPFLNCPSELVGFECDVDYDSKGYLDNFELGSKPVKSDEGTEWKKKN